ncbi:MAG: hypothetical protein ACK559_00585, partial [bacterium]
RQTVVITPQHRRRIRTGFSTLPRHRRIRRQQQPPRCQPLHRRIAQRKIPPRHKLSIWLKRRTVVPRLPHMIRQLTRSVLPHEQQQNAPVLRRCQIRRIHIHIAFRC